ncbi:MptD family putative ECF transporter S component [Microbacterium sp. JB110]|uniref:MptD family putative ECF transporter S component n=1 Tax=Microbacterium sp. JB110 TaxID=2024477 RepID=UPI00097F2B7E|nr:MptD family putative ECF transporter S component [Microbacterium sp. JB110]RCS61257.1 Trep_Strep domain-containing protein [Microbacterium sp. JB110]SJM51446.1 Substrate-specific component BL0695 of predicted ECF transporter [Frigoribacterium sp. JB110]
MTDDTLSAATPVATATAAERPRFSLTFRARDFLTIAIFAVIYIVVIFAVAMVGIISPLVMVITLPLAPLVAGIPYMLFLSRVRHGGMVTLFGIVFGLASMGWGHPWQSVLVIVGVSLIAEIVLFAGRYRSRWAAIWAYTIFSAWMIGPWIPMFLDRDAYLASQGSESMGSEYAAQMDALLSAPVILGVWAAGIVFGFLGGLLGSAVLRKHFVKAGLA